MDLRDLYGSCDDKQAEDLANTLNILLQPVLIGAERRKWKNSTCCVTIERRDGGCSLWYQGPATGIVHDLVKGAAFGENIKPNPSMFAPAI